MLLGFLIDIVVMLFFSGGSLYVFVSYLRAQTGIMGGECMRAFDFRERPML